MESPSTSRVLTLTAIFSVLLVTLLFAYSHTSSQSGAVMRRLQVATSVPQEAPKPATVPAAATSAVPQAAPASDTTGGLTTALVTNKFAAGTLEGAEASRGYKEIKGTHFPNLISSALAHKRGRKMNDLTKDPTTNSLQTLLNTWTDGSYSPVHKVGAFT